MNLKEQISALRRRRDERIVRMSRGGATQEEIGKIFCITKARVGQILAQYKGGRDHG